MVYYFRVEYKNYYNIEVPDLLCPLSGKMEPMRLVLYQKEVETLLSKQYVKKPSGVFFRISDNKDIPASKWTSEMEVFFEQQKVANPVPKKGLKVSWPGKFIIAFAIILILAFFGWLGYTLFIKKPMQENAKAELLQLPKKGEQYRVGVPVTNYDSNGKATSKGSDMRWVEVQEVNSADSTCVIRLMEELSYGAVIEPHVQKAQKDEKTFVTKFKILSDNEIEFAVKDGEGFNARTYGSLDNVKR